MHSRTIVADEDSLVAILTRERVDYIAEHDKVTVFNISLMEVSDANYSM